MIASARGCKQTEILFLTFPLARCPTFPRPPCFTFSPHLEIPHLFTFHYLLHLLLRLLTQGNVIFYGGMNLAE